MRSQPLAWVACLPVLWFAYGSQTSWLAGAAAFLAFTFGNAGFLVAFVGLRTALLMTSLAIVGYGLMFALAVLFGRFVYNKLGALWALAAFPACWTALEYLTSLASPNGTVGALAYTQVGAPILIQSAALFGFSSVTFLLCLTANGVALALSSRRQAPALVVIVASAFALNLGWGALRLHEALGASVRVAAAAKDQSDTQLVRDETYWRAVTEAYAAGARRLAQAGASTIVLPEKLATLTPEWRGPVLAPLATAAREARVRIVAGFDDEDTNHNRAIVFDPDGTVSTYDKRRLVVGLEVARPGDHAGWLGGGLGVAICKDMDFPQMIRNDARSGIRLMLVPAEDFYVDRWMHARIAIMRGVENGFAVVRAARKGDVTISDDRGRLLARAASSTAFAGNSVVDAPLGSGATLYLMVGDAFAWFCLGAVLLIGGLAVARKPILKAT